MAMLNENSVAIGRQSGMEELAAEILLVVISQLSDLPSLRNLINASPAAFRLFKTYGVEITESILTSGNTTKQIPEIIRLIALIRSSSLPIHGLQEFKTRVVAQCMVQVPTADAFLPESLSKDIPSVVLRSILASAHRISLLTPNCLSYYLDQLQTIKPEVPVDGNFSYGRGRRRKAARKHPESRRLLVEKLEPPAWIEVQRVERAFWRVQFFYDLKMAASQSLLSWSAADLESLQNMEPKDLYDDTRYPEFEEINTIVDYIQHLRARKASDLQVSGVLPLPSTSFENSNWPILVPGKEDIMHLPIEAPALWIFRGISHNINHPLRYISFESFRRFGLALWSQERVASLGLVRPVRAPDDREPSKPIDFYYFTWRSILSTDEILEAENVIQQRDQDR
ncbi:hypothetical protein G7Y89_g2926 [Cudoniella acicularis]|uniref:Uncharacterized protein n=1 Tax=Cudoniella acicularis TaxID=354080 RepID=A0A8H4RTL2_9HELO|nr:hypothetical protein G7Y89_g2926 [Cudoniella acicularis]